MNNSKQEVIEKAYGQCYDSCRPDENGWSNHTALMCFVKDKELDSKVKGDNLVYRPISLQGIETNNGWIKIESEKDLPMNSSSYWIMQSDGLIQTFKEYEENLKYWKIKATHYQPIIKPQPPIH